MRKSKITSLLILFGIVSTPAAVVYAACGGVEEYTVSEAFGAYSQATLADFTSGYVNLYATGEQTRMLVLSAFTTLAKQINAVSEKEIQTGTEITKTYAETQKQLELEQMSSDIVMKQLSQGYDPCGSYNRDKTLHSAEQTARVNIAQTVGTYDYGKFADRTAVLSSRDQEHRSKYCTQDEQNAGICSMVNSNLAGADMNPSFLLSAKSNPSADEKAAKKAYIQNILGLPDPLPPSGLPKSSLDGYTQVKAEKDVFVGMAAHSLTRINEENESIVPLLRERGEQYFGSNPRGLAWQKSLTVQEDVGVLRDLIQIQALILKDAQLSLIQGLGMEGNIAALSKMATKKQSDQIRAAESRLAGQSAANHIK
ncbi:hypothetical protein R6242_21365 [Iodobacter sp. CM08]|uniref:hypothetical protein n=1 Tax=Iodobacter sp. CM08 TaxID=3085902 RepID=UPI0029815E71|nr:hypothetical protein [Iodobacter sp. CM08]MDW5419126.1 hypothetical protein [Iodobacter sp. CM08]